MICFSRWSPVTALSAAILCIVSAPASAWGQSSGSARFAAGKAAFDKGDYEAAADDFSGAVKADGNNAQYHIWLGNAYAQHAIRSGMLTKARLASRMRDEWMRGAALDPTNYDAHEHLYEFYTQAPGLLGGSADRAAKEVTVMLRLNPYRAGLGLAGVEMSAKRYSAAESRMRALVAAYPDSVAVPAALAAAQADLQHYDEAWATIDAARARFPNNAVVSYMTGRVAALSGTRLDAGQSALENILATPTKIDSAYISPAHYRLGMILERKGDRPGARAQYAQAVRINPANSQAKKALEKLGRS